MQITPDNREMFNNDHRRKGAQMDVLMRGEEGTPDYFHIFVADLEVGFYSPRHHHNFDQVNLVVSGDYYRDAQGKPLPEGTVSYVPEGAFYGPLTFEEKPCRLIGMQLTGPTGWALMSYAEMTAAHERLEKTGHTESGVYHYKDADGVDHRKDSYEAIWENVNGQPLQYPQPRYNEPVHMIPERFAWVPTGQDGVEVRHLGTFNELRLAVQFFKLAPGARLRPESWPANVVAYVLQGSVSVSGSGTAGALGEGGCFMIEPGDTDVEVTADAETVLYTVWLPVRVRELASAANR